MKYPPIKSKVRFYTRTQSHIRSGLRLRCFGYDIIYKYDEWKFEFHFLEKINKKGSTNTWYSPYTAVAVEGTFGTLVEEGRMFLVNYLLL